MSLVTLYCNLLILFLSTFSHSSPIDSDHLHLRSSSSLLLNAVQPPAGQAQQCGFQGNSDVYGLGIRVGLYAQSLATWLGTFFICHEGLVLRSVNTLFSFAMLGGLFNLTVNASSSFAAEAFLLLQICLFSSYITFMEATTFSKRKRTSSKQQVWAMTTVMWMSFGYSVWFWWAGIDRFQRTRCGSFGFWYYKCDLFGGFRTLQKVLSILLIVVDVPIRGYNLVIKGDDWYTQKVDSVAYKRYLIYVLQRAYKELLLSSSDGRVPTAPRRASYPSTSKECSMVFAAREMDLLCANVGIDRRTAMKTFHALYEVDQTLTTISNTWTNIGFRSIRPKNRTRSFLAGHVGITWPRLIPLLRLYCRAVTLSLHALIARTYKRYVFRALALFVPTQHRHDRDALVFLNVAALEHPRYQLLEERWITVLTLTHIARLPKRNPWGYWSLSALRGAALCITQILSVELTLRWNSVYGLQGLGTVGQLIPFIIGVGGLLKVMNSGLKKWWYRVRYRGAQALEAKTRSKNEDGIDRELADAYARCKEAYEQLHGTASAEEKEAAVELERRLKKILSR